MKTKKMKKLLFLILNSSFLLCAATAHGAISYINTSVGSGTTSASVSAPSGTANNDVMVCVKIDRATSGTTTAPTGWTRVASTAGAQGRIEVFTGVIGLGGIGAGPWSFTGTTRTLARVVMYRGVDPTTPMDVAPSVRYNAPTVRGTTSITPVTNNNWILASFGTLTATYTWSNEAVATSPTLAERIESSYSTYSDLAVADGTQVSVSSTGTSTGTMSTAGYNAGALVALRPWSNPTLTSPGMTAGIGNLTVTSPHNDTAILTGVSATMSPGTITAAASCDIKFSDDFSTDPASRWATQWGSFSWGGGQYTATGSGGTAIFNTTTGSVTQYAKVQVVGDSGGVVLRGTGTALDGYYAVVYWSGSIYLSRYNNTGLLGDITSAAFTFSAGDNLAVTVSGTGANTVFKIWRNTANNTPYDVNNWDSASDPADATLTASGGMYYDTGTYVGLGMDEVATFDNWYGGSIGASCGGTNGTATLTGIVSTASLGNLSVSGTRSETASLTSPAMTSSKGSLNMSVDTTRTLAGLATTASYSSIMVSGNTAIPLTSPGMTSNKSSLAISGNVNIPIASPGMTSDKGSLAVAGNVNIPITSPGMTSNKGNLAISAGGSGGVSLTSPGSTASTGSLSVAGDAASSITSPGMISNKGSLAMTGGSGASLAPSGIGMTASRGNVTVSGNGNISLTSPGMTASKNSLGMTAGKTIFLSSPGITSTPGSLAVKGNATITLGGQMMTASAGGLSISSGAFNPGWTRSTEIIQ